MARRKGRRRPTRARGRNAKTRRGLTGPAAQPSRFVRRGKAPRAAHWTYLATGGLELGGTTTVSYRPAMLPGVGVFFFRRPARRYHHETVGGLVLGGAATVAYRPAVRRYVYAAAGGLLLGGSATVRYRSAPARKIWAADEIFALADDDLDALLLDGDEAHLLLAEDTAMDVERLVHRDAEGRITKITSHERDDTDRLADQVRRLVRQGIGVDAEGRFTLPVSAEMDESRLVYIVNSLRDRLQEGPADGCPRILTWKRDDPEPATARAAASARKPLGPIGFTSTR